MRHDKSTGQIDFLPMPPTPHPRIGWAFTCRAGGFSEGAWGACQEKQPDSAAPQTHPVGSQDAATKGADAMPSATGSASSTPAMPASAKAGDVPTSATADPSGLNLGALCGDDPAAVAQNRALLADAIGQPISWLKQVHGNGVFIADGLNPTTSAAAPEADAQISTQPGHALAVLVADCLPVLFADRKGRGIGAAHAGWRGLLDGVLEAAVQQMKNRVPDADLVTWLGPCIGPDAFEVGEEVRDAFVSRDSAAEAAFVPGVNPGKWLANLPMLARQRLARVGVTDILDSNLCTYRQPKRFWSFRRDRTCGRMAGVVWFKTPADPLP